MPYSLFLSHDHRDAPIAEAIASTLSRITLNQINVWFSSDKSRTGGILPGNVWLDEIRRRLSESRAVLPLLTPHSLSKPWLIFETGFGAAQSNCEVVPICLGISSLDTIPFPLAMYQCFQLADYESLKNLCSRLLAQYNIAFDEEMAKPVLERAIQEFSRQIWQDAELTSQVKPELAIVRDDIKEHIDRRLLDFFQRQADSSTTNTQRSGFVPYSVQISFKFPRLNTTQYLEIQEHTTVDDITDNIYFLLDGEVRAFTYLKSWILRHKKSNRMLVLREFGKDILARQLFHPNDIWEAIPLAHPYTWKDSADVDRWRRNKLLY